MAQTLMVLLWKMYILRKRRYIVTLLEIVVPIIMFWLLVWVLTLLPAATSTTSYDSSPIKYSDFINSNGLYLVDAYKIAYTPSNTFTDTIMATLSTNLNKSGQVTMVSKTSEDEVVEWLKQQYLDESANSTSSYNADVDPGIGVIFLNSDVTTSLSYVLRTTTNNLVTGSSTIYGEQSTYYYAYYEESGFLLVQTLIDQVYLASYQNVSIPDNLYIEYLPYSANSALQILALFLPLVITLGFNYGMSSLLRGVIEEKAEGAKEMMKIMGLKAWVNWVSWIMYSMVVYIPVTLIASILLTKDSSNGPAIDVNFAVLWVILLLFALAYIMFCFIISTFFSNGTIAVVVGLIFWYVGTFFLNTTFVNNPDAYSLTIHILTCLWPATPILWTIKTMGNFQANGRQWTLSDLFDDGAGGGRVSVGVAAIMLIVDMLLYTLITFYMDNVRPGPYGRAKPLTFIFQCFNKKKYDQQSGSNLQHTNFEAPPRDAKIGIRIENLRKSFNGGKVVAVENVDLDIYEGNITALLGHNGAGKTTTMSILAGFFSPTRGKVIVGGKNIFDNMDDFRSNLGLCPQHDLLFSFFTVIEHLIFFGMLKGLPKQRAEMEGIELLRTLKIDGKKDEMVSKLSGGMKRRLCLCISLIGNPKVLMLDEPTSGLDPESRRQVWDVLLAYRGHRTVIITTHFMEEADVLGDRIAIMDHGLVSCYGTSMFLKKLYGTGYHLNISKLEQAPVPAITRVVEHHVVGATTKQSSPSQLTYNIKSDESNKFPALFSALDTHKKELGVTAMGITCTTMEDVFLKVAEKPGNLTETNGNIPDDVFNNKGRRITGCSLILLQIKALVYKWFFTKLRNWFSLLIMIVIPILLTVYTTTQTMAYDSKADQPNLLITLASFPNTHVALSSSNTTVSSVVSGLVSKGGSTLDTIPTGTDFNDYFVSLIKNNLIQYEREVIAGFDFNSTMFLGGYSRSFIHAFPLVLNMVANSLLQIDNATTTSSITVYNHPIVVEASADVCELAQLSATHTFLFPQLMTYLSLAFIIFSMSFIALPLKERVNSGKQLQLMTGVSPVLYWTVLFVCDFVIYLIVAALMIACMIIFQTNSVYTSSGYIGTLVFLFVLTGLNVLAFSYIFSFLARSSVKASVYYILVTMITGTVASVFLAIIGKITTNWDFFRYIFGFNPIYSITTAFTYLLTSMYIDGLCSQCGSNCEFDDPLQFFEPGVNGKHPNGIYNSLIYLVVDFVLYFGIVLMIEYGITKKLWFLISKIWIKSNYDKLYEDSDVSAEKDRVTSPSNLRGYNGNTAVLRVKDLGKKYNSKMTAVNGVSFLVDEGECFGLLGVNGAGKSTTFKMLTGEEIPNKGDATILDSTSLLKHKSKFLAQVGYCPQFDAINEVLTGKQMLRVYALLRGISSDHCEREVARWIKIMGLTEFGDRRCGTYSGGNKRKLSTAMAFIGEPPVVFLDEPTSGVDPVSRRKLWDVVAKCQRAGQAIVLTSHSMEECEALCSRLTIMVGGQMKCIGTTQHLKHKFGLGYTIQIKLLTAQDSQANTSQLKNDMINSFRGCVIKDEHVGLLHYHVPDPTISLGVLFSRMENLKSTHGIIEDYVVGDTTLEQVFMSFARLEKTTQL